jgi:trigger factor
MHVTKTTKTPTQVNLVINASEPDMAPIKRHVLGHFAGKVKIPGFRAGKAPAAMIEKHVDQNAFLDEFMEHSINELYRKAAEAEKIRPVATPDVKLKKFVPFTELEFEADVEVIGNINLPNYKTIKLAKKKPEITAKDVNDVVKNLQERISEKVEVDRPAKIGDETIIDFEGRNTSEKLIDGASGKDYPLILGSKTFIPGFEEKLVGLKTGDEKTFSVQFPDDYSAKELQGKKTVFKVRVIKVNELKVPKADDDFAAKAGPFKTLAELKKDIKTQLTQERQRTADQEYENELIKKIVDNSTVEIPDVLIEEQLTRMEDEEKRNLIYKGQTWQEHLKAEGITEEAHRLNKKPDADLRVKAGLVLSEIADKEQLTVLPEELELKIKTLKSQYTDPNMQRELDKPENQQDIAARILTEKTVFKLVDYASK